MGGSIIAPPIIEQGGPAGFSLGVVTGLLDTLEESLLVAERSGRILLANSRARQNLASLGLDEISQLNLFTDLLKVDAKEIFGEIKAVSTRSRWRSPEKIRIPASPCGGCRNPTGLS